MANNKILEDTAGNVLLFLMGLIVLTFMYFFAQPIFMQRIPLHEREINALSYNELKLALQYRESRIYSEIIDADAFNRPTQKLIWEDVYRARSAMDLDKTHEQNTGSAQEQQNQIDERLKKISN